jgi:hypothetical protein
VLLRYSTAIECIHDPKEIIVSDRLADQITIRLTTEERTAIERIAEEEQRSVAFVARQGVRMLLGQNPQTTPPAPAAAGA